VKARVLTADLVWVVHWFSDVAPVAEADKPAKTKPTVGVGFVKSNDVAPLIEIEAMTGVEPAAEPPLSEVALARMFVMR
jgi:hypothetical protein